MLQINELTLAHRKDLRTILEDFNLALNDGDKAVMIALIAGVIGTAFMAGSTFAVTAQPPHIMLCILLAIPGFTGWILPYFLYKRMVCMQTEKITPLIEAKYDEICEKGNKLLHNKLVRKED